MLLFLCILDTEDREYRRNKNKQRCIDEMSPRADALSEPECRQQYRIVAQATIRVEESLRLENVGLGINGRIMKDSPAESLNSRHTRVQDNLLTKYFQTKSRLPLVSVGINWQQVNT